jgi:aryl-alcohol dehydrogenase-like predicted oxidoreductase
MRMKKKRITNTELECSAIVLGSADMGDKLKEQESFRLMDMYLDSGGNMIDTAEVYGNWLPVGKSISEMIIGKWMQERKNRSQLIVTTKGGHQDLATMHIPRVAPKDIAADLEGSLRRLQVETIDLYWLHRDDPSRPVGEIIEMLNEQRNAGKIRYFGCSNWQTARIAEAQSYAEAHSLQTFSASQVWWSVAAIDRSKVADPDLAFMDEAMYQYHQKTQLSAFAYSSQAKGLFTKMESASIESSDFELPELYRLTENGIRYLKLKRLADELSVTISQVVLAYLISQAIPSFPIIGSRTPAQLKDSLKSTEVSLTPAQLKLLL